MLDDDHRVALVAQAAQAVEQPPVVALVQADGRLVEHVEHAGQARADLARQPDPLRFAARERARVARERQIVEPDIDQKPQPRADLLDDRRGDLVLLPAELPRRRLDPGQRLADRQLRDLADMVAGDLYRQRLGPQPMAVAGMAGPAALIALELLADPGAVGLAIAPLHVRNDALEGPLDRVDAAAVIIAELDRLVVRAAQHHLADVLGQLGPGRRMAEAVVLGQRLQRLPEIGRLLPRPGGERALHQAQALVRHDQPLVEEQLGTQAAAIRAGAERRVEREQPRLDLRDRKTRNGAGELFREHRALGLALGWCGLDHGNAVGQAKGCGKTVGKPLLDPGLHDDAVDDDVDIVPELLVERRRLVQVVELAVHLDPLKALLAQVGELLAVLALAVADHRREQVQPRALGHRQHAVDHVADLLRLDRQPGGGRIGRAGPGEHQAQVVVDLGDGADRRARVAAGRLLLDGDRRAEALDVVDIRLLHHLQKLPRIGRERLDIAPLPLGIDRVEGQRRLARAGQPGDDRQRVARDVDVDVLEVVLARAAHADEFFGHAGPASDSGAPDVTVRARIASRTECKQRANIRPAAKCPRHARRELS